MSKDEMIPRAGFSDPDTPVSLPAVGDDCITCYERDEKKCFDGMCQRTGCRLRNERLASPAISGVTVEDLLLKTCQTLSPHIFARGLDPLPGDGPATRRRIEETKNTARKVLDAILSSIGSEGVQTSACMDGAVTAEGTNAKSGGGK